MNSNRNNSSALSFPLSIFHVFRDGRRAEGELLRGFRVQYESKTYEAPSPAASKATGHSENGWLFWRFSDPVTGIERPIDELRLGQKKRPARQ